MAKFIVDVPYKYLGAVDIVKAINYYWELPGITVSVYEDDTGTRNSQAPDRRQSTRRLHDKAQARWKK